MQQLPIKSWLEITNNNNTSEGVVFNSICFHLNREILQEIAEAKAKKSQLKLTPSYLEELRIFTLVEQTGLTFYSHYNNEILLKSIIFPDGKIINQISKNCLENPETEKIITVHNWLIEQLLINLTLEKREISLTWLTWVLALILVIIIGLLNLSNLTPITPVKIIAPIVMFFLFQWGIKKLLQQFPITWKRKLFSGIFSPNAKLRQITWYLLEKIKI